MSFSVTQESAVRVDPYPTLGFRFRIGEKVRLSARKPQEGEPVWVVLWRRLTEVEDGQLLREYGLRKIETDEYRSLQQVPYELRERELAPWEDPPAELRAAS